MRWRLAKKITDHMRRYRRGQIKVALRRWMRTRTAKEMGERLSVLMKNWGRNAN